MMITLRVDYRKKYSVTKTGGRWILYFENTYKSEIEVHQQLAQLMPLIDKYKFDVRYSVTFVDHKSY